MSLENDQRNPAKQPFRQLPLPATQTMMVNCPGFLGLAYRDGQGAWRRAADNGLLPEPTLFWIENG